MNSIGLLSDAFPFHAALRTTWSQDGSGISAGRPYAVTKLGWNDTPGFNAADIMHLLGHVGPQKIPRRCTQVTCRRTSHIAADPDGKGGMRTRDPPQQAFLDQQSFLVAENSAAVYPVGILMLAMGLAAARQRYWRSVPVFFRIINYIFLSIGTTTAVWVLAIAGFRFWIVSLMTWVVSGHNWPCWHILKIRPNLRNCQLI